MADRAACHVRAAGTSVYFATWWGGKVLPHHVHAVSQLEPDDPGAFVAGLWNADLAWALGLEQLAHPYDANRVHGEAAERAGRAVAAATADRQARTVVGSLRVLRAMLDRPVLEVHLGEWVGLAEVVWRDGAPMATGRRRCYAWGAWVGLSRPPTWFDLDQADAEMAACPVCGETGGHAFACPAIRSAPRSS